MNKTLGGDRLGSGAKMDVDLHGYGYSTHDPSYLFSTTASPATLIPFMSRLLLPGDDWDIRLRAEALTHPTVGPLFGSYKLQLDVFMVPIRLYNSLLHNNALDIGNDISKVKIPQLTLKALPTPDGTEDINISQISPSSIAAYLGIRGIGITNEVGGTLRDFNALPFLMYWDIYKQYYANKQEKIGAVIHADTPTPIAHNIAFLEIDPVGGGSNVGIPEVPSGSPNVVPLSSGDSIDVFYTGAEPDWTAVILILDVGVTDTNVSLFDLTGGTINQISPGQATGTVDAAYVNEVPGLWAYQGGVEPLDLMPKVATFDLKNIDAMRKAILAYSSETVPFSLNSVNLPPYNWIHEHRLGIPNLYVGQEGLAIKTYQSDLNNNWLDGEFYSYISAATAISTAGDSFTIDQLNLSNKMYNILMRVAVSGGSYLDWLGAVYAEVSVGLAESPVYKGGLSKEIVFQQVISNAATGEQPLGTLAGRGVMGDKHKGGFVNLQTKEPAYAMGIVSITPRIVYSQFNNWDMKLKTLNDLHKPELNQIGFQDLDTTQLAWWDSEWDGVKWTTKSAGKQPAWINYMTDVNRSYGNFAVQDSEMFMMLDRRYEYGEGTGIVDLTTYIDPAKFNFIFADTAVDAQNFWLQIGVDIKARRKMSAKVMPNL